MLISMIPQKFEKHLVKTQMRDIEIRVQLQDLFHSIVCMDAENRARHAPTGKQQLHFKERCQSSL